MIHTWVLASNIAIRVYVLDICGQCCLFCMWVVSSNIVIGMSILDM